MRRAALIATALLAVGCGEDAARQKPLATPANGATGGPAPPGAGTGSGATAAPRAAGAGAGSRGVPAPPDAGAPAGHAGDLEAQFARTVRGFVRVPERDGTPPLALLQLDTGAGKPVVHAAPVRSQPSAAVALARPELAASGLIRDPDGGTGRIRVSIVYVTRCGGRERQHAAYFPPAQIENVRIPPGVRVPVQRERSARLRFPAGCEVRGKAFVEATNAHGLESFSDPIVFRYTPRRASG